MKHLETIVGSCALLAALVLLDLPRFQRTAEPVARLGSSAQYAPPGAPVGTSVHCTACPGEAAREPAAARHSGGKADRGMEVNAGPLDGLLPVLGLLALSLLRQLRRRTGLKNAPLKVRQRAGVLGRYTHLTGGVNR